MTEGANLAPVQEGLEESPPERTSPKRGKRGGKLTVEHIYQSVSNRKAYGDYPPNPKFVLTPRSAEACLRTGVDPEDLRIRDLDSFWEPGLDPALQALRHESNTEMRYKAYEMVKTARNQIQNEEVSLRRSKGKRGRSSKNRKLVLDKAKGQWQLELEQRRLEKVQRRQQKEIEQMVQFEMRMTQLQEQAARKQSEEDAKLEKKKKIKERLAKRKTELSRMKELKRAAEQELEEKKRRQLAARQFRKAQQLEEERKRQEAVARAEARRREIERQKKHEEHQAQTKRIMDQQQAIVEARMKEMQAAEKARKEAMARKREEEAARLAKRTEVIQKRIKRNHQKLLEVERQRKEAYNRKQQVSKERRERMREQEAIRAVEKKKMRDLTERRRKMLLEEKNRTDELHKHELMSKQAIGDQTLAEIMQHKEKERMLKKERAKLKKEQKRVAIERKRRQDEYKRLKTLKKIQEDARRGEEIAIKKEGIIRSRKQMAIQARIQRDRIIDSMQRIRRTKQWNKASTIVESTQSPGSLSSTGKRRKRNKKKKGGLSSSATLRPSASAPGLAHTLGATPTMTTPMPPHHGSSTRFSATPSTKRSDHHRPKPMPYVSPYEQQQSIEVSTGQPGKMVPAFAHVEAATGLVTF